ncbi:MAG TPA: ankyrin repeat domain-containing protein [Pyrinomonadaceae bacterium]|nr:ankyrin repeat domain-containing protein [Pyrinomonadaceae bacterium]
MSKTRIIELVRNLDLESTRELLAAKPSLLTATDRQGRNLLHIACSASCSDLKVPESLSARMVNFLLDLGIDIESQVGQGSCGGCNALWFAVGRGRNPTLVKLLLKRGAKPTRAPGGALYAAGWYEDIELLDLLIRAGAPVDVVVEITPFLACWCWKKFVAAKFLALKGANVNYQDRKGKTALHYGLEKEFDPSLLRWLVKHGASPDIEDHEGVSPRLKASRKRDKKFLAALK